MFFFFFCQQNNQASFSYYEVCFNMLRTGGNTVIGYVKTKNATETSAGVWEQSGFRSLSDIESDLRLWNKEFVVDGIFLDEVSNIWQVTENAAWGNHVAFYMKIFALIDEINANWTIVINPGSPFPIDFFSTPRNALNRTADIALVYESSSASWDPTQHGVGSTCLDGLWSTAQGSYSPGPWCPYVPVWDGIDSIVAGFEDGTFAAYDKYGAVALYGANSSLAADSAGGVGSIVAQAVRWNMTYIYVTDSPKVRLHNTHYLIFTNACYLTTCTISFSL
jgi:hypothetical protein